MNCLVAKGSIAGPAESLSSCSRTKGPLALPQEAPTPRHSVCLRMHGGSPGPPCRAQNWGGSPCQPWKGLELWDLGGEGTSSQPNKCPCPPEGPTWRRTSSGPLRGPWLPRCKAILGYLQVSIPGSMSSGPLSWSLPNSGPRNILQLI